MVLVSWGTFFTIGLLLIPLIYLQRFLQREIQSIFLLITRQPEISMALFSIIFLPGVVIHEISHFLMATLLGVRTGRFSILPKKIEGGRIRLGYVETASTDFVRDALIGAAPLISGGIFVAYVGASRLGLNNVLSIISLGQLNAINLGIQSVLAQPDFWLWFYLIFVVSNTMFPSASDRRAWLPLILVMIIILGLILLIGAGPWIISQLGSTIKTALDAIIMVLGITALIDLVLLPPTYFIRRIISRILGLQVV
jgi:hypothetical protein